jgi:hypothetical protein
METGNHLSMPMQQPRANRPPMGLFHGSRQRRETNKQTKSKKSINERVFLRLPESLLLRGCRQVRLMF